MNEEWYQEEQRQESVHVVRCQLHWRSSLCSGQNTTVSKQQLSKPPPALLLVIWYLEQTIISSCPVMLTVWSYIFIYLQLHCKNEFLMVGDTNVNPVRDDALTTNNSRPTNKEAIIPTQPDTKNYQMQNWFTQGFLTKIKQCEWLIGLVYSF